MTWFKYCQDLAGLPDRGAIVAGQFEGAGRNATGFADQLGNFLRVLLLGGMIVQDDVGTFACDGNGCGTADSGIRTGHQCLSAGQSIGPR